MYTLGDKNIYIYICIYMYVYLLYIYIHVLCMIPGSYLKRAGRCGSALFLLFFNTRSFVKVNEDVLMATREKILLEEVSTLP